MLIWGQNEFTDYCEERQSQCNRHDSRDWFVTEHETHCCPLPQCAAGYKRRCYCTGMDTIYCNACGLFDEANDGCGVPALCSANRIAMRVTCQRRLGCCPSRRSDKRETKRERERREKEERNSLSIICEHVDSARRQ